MLLYVGDFMLYIIKNKKLMGDRIKSLRDSFGKSRVYHPKDISKFIFLCGANNGKNKLSERRKALLDFSKSKLPHVQFFLAEKMFVVLKNEGHKGNLLDIETEISKFADHIIIVLESNSAFAELGAFSHKDLRNKLIVINDSKFKNEDSFINLGPIAAIKEQSGNEYIIQYRMNKNGVTNRDAIGDVFQEVYDLLESPKPSRDSALNLVDCDPSQNFNKISATFIHDLIYFSGPINYKELVEVVKIIFGENQDYKDLKSHLAILVSFEYIKQCSNGQFYRSTQGKYFLRYDHDVETLIATFRNYASQVDPNRIYAT